MKKGQVLFLLFGMTLPMVSMGDTLRLSSDTLLDVHAIDEAELTRDAPEMADLLLQPLPVEGEREQLPEHCLITADARLDGERVRIVAKSLTCIDTQGEESEIYSGDFTASGMENDGSYGIDACTSALDGDCQRAELRPDHVFKMYVGETLSLEPQDNPGARINEQRRQADGEGIANPIPRQNPDPERP